MNTYRIQIRSQEDHYETNYFVHKVFLAASDEEAEKVYAKESKLLKSQPTWNSRIHSLSLERGEVTFKSI